MYPKIRYMRQKQIHEKSPYPRLTHQRRMPWTPWTRVQHTHTNSPKVWRFCHFTEPNRRLRDGYPQNLFTRNAPRNSHCYGPKTPPRYIRSLPVPTQSQFPPKPQHLASSLGTAQQELLNWFCPTHSLVPGVPQTHESIHPFWRTARSPSPKTPAYDTLRRTCLLKLKINLFLVSSIHVFTHLELLIA